MKAHEHKAYNDAIRHAAKRAYESRNESTKDNGYFPPCFKVWFDDEAIYVRTAEAAAPKEAKLVCIAQAWDKNGTVQVRFDGGYSEFLNF